MLKPSTTTAIAVIHCYGAFLIMTNNKLELAKELDNKMKKLKSFLHYYKDSRYRLSIHLDNKDSECYHSEVFHFKEEDINLNELIERELSIKLSEMQKTFDEL